MRTANRSSITPQRKLINVQNKFGNTGIKKQQGTTRVLYDSLPIDGRTTFRFFEGSNNRDFPLTNMGSGGNKLSVGEAMVLERTYMSKFDWDVATSSITAPVPAFLPQQETAEFQVLIANTVVMKPISTTSFNPLFNKNAYHDQYNNFEFDTQLTISPLVEFVVEVRTVLFPALVGTFYRCTLEGVGAILSPRNTQ